MYLRRFSKRCHYCGGELQQESENYDTCKDSPIYLSRNVRYKCGEGFDIFDFFQRALTIRGISIPIHNRHYDKRRHGKHRIASIVKCKFTNKDRLSTISIHKLRNGYYITYYQCVKCTNFFCELEKVDHVR